MRQLSSLVLGPEPYIGENESSSVVVVSGVGIAVMRDKVSRNIVFAACLGVM